MKNIKTKKGFTLVELIVVVAVLVILASVAIPNFVFISSKAAITTDIANLMILNNATQYYKITKNIKSEDIFNGIGSDLDRIIKLINEGYLAEEIETQKNDTFFYWNVASQKWLYSLLELTETPLPSYLFSGLDYENYLYTGNWDNSEEGFSSRYGLLFMDNNKDEYAISTKAQLAEGTYGGYGILFETSLVDEDHDSGYVLQFDRGYNAIIIRPRNNGNEESPVLVLRNSDCPLIPGNKEDDWWSQEHEITLQVNNIDTDSGNKELSVWIDNDSILDDWYFESNTESENNYTGFRSWGVETTYKEMDIE